MPRFVVVGLGKFGSSVAEELYRLGQEVLAVDKDEEKLENILNKVTHAVKVDATEEEALKAAGVKDFDVAIVGISEIRESVLTTMLLKELGIRRVVAKANDEIHCKILGKIGADEVVLPEREMGERLARKLVFSSVVLDMMPIGGDYAVVRIKAPDMLVSRKIRDIAMDYDGMKIVAVERKGQPIVYPKASETILKDDVLVMICKKEVLERLGGYQVSGQ